MEFRLTLELHLTSFVANLENITQITLVSLLLTLNEHVLQKLTIQCAMDRRIDRWMNRIINRRTDRQKK